MVIEFFRRLFGHSGAESDDGKSGYSDTRGIYLFVECDRCGARLRLRADKKYDLNRSAEGYTWHKTLIDSQCFRPMPTVVTLDRNFNIVSREIEGGRYITREEFAAEVSEPDLPETDETPSTDDEQAAEEQPPEQ